MYFCTFSIKHVNFRSKAITVLLTGSAASFVVLFFSVDLVCFILLFFGAEINDTKLGK